MNDPKHQKGLIQAILILIIALVVVSFFGFSPQTIWVEYLEPIFVFIWKIIVAIVDFVVKLLQTAWGAAKYLVDIIQSI